VTGKKLSKNQLATLRQISRRQETRAKGHEREMSQNPDSKTNRAPKRVRKPTITLPPLPWKATEE
jgi:hypothetical protein